MLRGNCLRKKKGASPGMGNAPFISIGTWCAKPDLRGFFGTLSFVLLVVFELLLEFGALLGLDFVALLPLLVELLFGAQQFDECLLGTVALLETGADNAQVAALAIAVARSHG